MEALRGKWEFVFKELHFISSKICVKQREKKREKKGIIHSVSDMKINVEKQTKQAFRT